VCGAVRLELGAAALQSPRVAACLARQRQALGKASLLLGRAGRSGVGREDMQNDLLSIPSEDGRNDCLRARLTDEQIEMITYFEKLVNEDHESESYMLQNGDILVLNNRRVMHKRSGFSDWNRHLLRIRFNPISA
jgi:hypothetical protein